MNDNNQLITLNQNTKLALIKSKNLLDITKKILDKKELIQNFQFKHFLRQHGHSDIIKSIQITTDGKYIVSGSADSTIKIWDFQTGECIKTLKVHKDSVNSVEISLDGKYIISGSADSTIKIWDFQTGKCLKTIEGHTDYDEIYLVKISSDGKHIISFSYEGLSIWRIEDGFNTKYLNIKTLLLISDNQQYVVSKHEDTIVKIWDIESKRCVMTINNHNNEIQSVAISADEKYLITSWEKTVKIWDIESGKCFKTIGNHVNHVNMIAISNDGEYIVSSTKKETELIFGQEANDIKIWNFHTGKCIKTIFTDKFHADSLNISANGKHLIVGISSEIRIYDMINGNCLQSFNRLSFDSYILSKDERHLISVGNAKLKIWDIKNCECLNVLEEYSNLRSSSISIEKNLLVACDDNTIKVWNLIDGKHLKTLYDEKYKVVLVSISSDAKYVVSCGRGYIKIWDLAKGICLHTINKTYINIYRDNVYIDFYELNISPDNKYVIIGNILHDDGFSRNIEVLDIQSGKSLGIFNKTNQLDFSSFTISSDGKYIISSSENLIEIWDFQTQKWIKNIDILSGLEEDYILPISLVVSVDGRYIVSRNVINDGYDEFYNITIWDIQTGKCLYTLHMHYLEITSVAISPTEQYLIYSTIDGLINIWDMYNRVNVKTFFTYDKRINTLNISSDEKYLFSSNDESIDIWDFSTGEMVYTINYLTSISIDKEGYFIGSDENINKYLRVSESPLTQRKLTPEEIKHFRKKGNFLEIEENTEKLKKYHEIFEIDIDEDEDEDEIPF